MALSEVLAGVAPVPEKPEPRRYVCYVRLSEEQDGAVSEIAVRTGTSKATTIVYLMQLGLDEVSRVQKEHAGGET